MSLDSSHSAGDRRRKLCREATESAGWRALAETTAALASAHTPEQACAAVLMRAVGLLGLSDGAIVARRSARLQVLASHGRALPAGASLPLSADRMPAWLLPPCPQDIRCAGIPIELLGQPMGELFVAWQGGAPLVYEDLAALRVFAALLPAVVAEPQRSAARRRRAAALDRLSALSARERQVLSLLPRGLTNAALAAELGISPGTAKVHVERILHKLHVSDRTQAAVYAVQAGVSV